MASPTDSASGPMNELQKQESAPASSQDNTARFENVEVKEVKKKKKRSKPKKKPTGFEEYFCEGPMTPAEYQEEKTVLYPPHRSFVDRIEECIQRYRARRRLDNRRELMFSKYLMLGGIDATVRQFQGTKNIGDEVLAEASKATIREITADDVIQRGGTQDGRFYNPNYPEHWDVDFTGVVSGFLSQHLRGLPMDEYWMGIEVVHNFLNYVDHHEVCPEYADDLKAAQQVCMQAVKEMPAIEALFDMVPGDFNTALRFLYCRNDENDSWEFDNYNQMPEIDRREAQARRAVSVSIWYGRSHCKIWSEWAVTGTIERDFEILETKLPDTVALAKYKAVNQHLSNCPDIEPCGTMIVRPVVTKDGWENTMGAMIPPHEVVESSFILEESILKLLTVGMKLRLTVCTINHGEFKFIKHFKDIRPSFYVFLPQELMLKYKEPVLNERPGPSIHDDANDEGDAGAQDE
ncbi:hypothetical protein VTK26DRAFT_4377 [Humicola hyalothermophila]